MPLDDEYETWKSGQKSPVSKFFKNISNWQFFIFCLMLLGLFLIWKSSGDKATKIMALFFVLFIFIFFFTKSRIELTIDDEQAKKIAYEKLKKKQGKEIPVGCEITTGPYCNLIDDFWYIQFTLKNNKGLIKEGVIKISVRGGFVGGIIELPTGYTGKELIDKEKIEPFFIEKYQEKT